MHEAQDEPSLRRSARHADECAFEEWAFAAKRRRQESEFSAFVGCVVS